MPSDTLLLGHRGAGANEPIAENTTASFDRSLAYRADGFEFDVRLTADAEAVICHNPRIGKFKISTTPAHALAHILTLRQVLQRYRSKAFLDIELKVTGLETILIALLKQFPPRRGFVVSSFLPEVLLSLHATAPKIPLGLICESRKQLMRWCEFPVKYVIPYHRLVSRKILKEIRSEDKKVLVWTVNHPATMRRFASWGVDGIISDKPGLLIKTLRPAN